MSVRGCAYAGSKGVVWGPVKDRYTYPMDLYTTLGQEEGTTERTAMSKLIG